MAPIDYSKWDNIDTDSEPETSPQQATASASVATHSASGSIQTACRACTDVPWLTLQAEDLPGYPHHASLEALLASTRTCIMCSFILHAAVSNYRRSLEAPSGTYHWRRFETVSTLETPSSNAMRKATYVKVLGPCMPYKESDVCGSQQGGYFTPMKEKVLGTYEFSKAVMLQIIGMTERTDEEPVEDALLELAELTKEIPRGYGVWLYGNWWARHGPDGSISTDKQYVGVGARFGGSGYMFDSINNPGGDILIRGSALAVCVESGKFPPFFRHYEYYFVKTKQIIPCLRYRVVCGK